MVAHSMLIRPDARKKTRKKAQRKAAKKIQRKKTTRRKAPGKRAGGSRSPAMLRSFHAPPGFQISPAASARLLDQTAVIDALRIEEADAASDLTRIRKNRQEAENELKQMVQAEDPTGTLFQNSVDSDAGGE